MSAYKAAFAVTYTTSLYNHDDGVGLGNGVWDLISLLLGEVNWMRIRKLTKAGGLGLLLGLAYELMDTMDVY
jgi:hypothetical protein